MGLIIAWIIGLFLGFITGFKLANKYRSEDIAQMEKNMELALDERDASIRVLREKGVLR